MTISPLPANKQRQGQPVTVTAGPFEQEPKGTNPEGNGPYYLYKDGHNQPVSPVATKADSENKFI